jgi:hypothetical protein
MPVNAVWFRVRTQLRVGWLSFVGLAVMVGVAGGTVVAAVAAARRTDSAFDRMVEANRTADALVNPDFGIGSALTMDDLRALPSVERAGRIDFAPLPTEPPPTDAEDLGAWFSSFGVLTIPHDGVTEEFERPVVDEGRLPDPTRPDEVFVERWWADAEGVEVGDTLAVTALVGDAIPALEAAQEAGDADEAIRVAAAGQPTDLTVVGIGGGADSVAFDEDYEPLPWLGTEAFWERHDRPTAGFWGAAVLLRSGSEVEDLRSDLARIHPDEPFAVQGLDSPRVKVERAVRPQVIALWAFAGVAAFVGVLVVGQAISRRLGALAGDDRTLAAMGVTRRDRFASSMVLVTLVAALGSAVAATLAVAASP